jgi:hypothetical protein
MPGRPGNRTTQHPDFRNPIMAMRFFVTHVQSIPTGKGKRIPVQQQERSTITTNTNIDDDLFA